jgi:hypothetical protein
MKRRGPLVRLVQTKPHPGGKWIFGANRHASAQYHKL